VRCHFCRDSGPLNLHISITSVSSSRRTPTRDETDELTAYFETLTFHVRVNPRNPKNPKYNIKRQSLGYIASNAFNDRDQKEWGTEYADIDTAPELLQRFRAKLSAHVGKDVNYMSILKYPDGNAHIDWHQHGEDRWHDSPVWDVSVGPTERMFWAREIDNPKTTKIGVLAEVGSLITLPSSMNTTHQHAILKDETTSVRYSINCKSLPLTGVWDCHAGKRYPADAVYVGCRVVDRKGNVIRKGTIFGNGAAPFVSREGGFTTEAEFREYAERKMQDPEFRAKVGGLRGKHLLCWCVQTGPKREEFCHARVWLEIANRKELY
jgi:alkylated DNA repair dioxygenase AlkB